MASDTAGSLISRVALWYHLLATGLLQSADSPPRFRSGPRGKPYLTTSLRRPAQKGSDVEEAVKVGFNVSHEGRWVLLGVLETALSNDAEAEALELGVDVMVSPSDPFDLKEALIPQVSAPLLLGLLESSETNSSDDSVRAPISFHPTHTSPAPMVPLIAMGVERRIHQSGGRWSRFRPRPYTDWLCRLCRNISQRGTRFPSGKSQLSTERERDWTDGGESSCAER